MSATFAITAAIAGEDVRALYAQPLYDNGIGFFPVRGNHDDGAAEAAEFQALYPQTQNGIHNFTPAARLDYRRRGRRLRRTKPTWASRPFPIPVRPSRSAATSAAPIPGKPAIDGPDVFVRLRERAFHTARPIHTGRERPPTPAYDSSTTIGQQQPWITAQLQGRYAGSHAFVFAHKGLITMQHADVLFGSSPAVNPALTDAFINSMASHGVRYFIHGHDHMYDRSNVTTTTGSAKVTQILASSNSSKFYVPAGSLTNSAANGGKSNDDYYDLPAFGIRRRQPLSQQLNSVGFQIVTVDGPNVTVDYYAAIVAIDMTLSINKGATSELQIPAVSRYTFAKQEMLRLQPVRQGVRGSGILRHRAGQFHCRGRRRADYGPDSLRRPQRSGDRRQWRSPCEGGQYRLEGEIGRIESQEPRSDGQRHLHSLGHGRGARLRRDGYLHPLTELRFGARQRQRRLFWHWRPWMRTAPG